MSEDDYQRDLIKKVIDRLLKENIENAHPEGVKQRDIDIDACDRMIASVFKEVGMDPANNMGDSVKRVRKMWLEETFKGLWYENFPKCSLFEAPPRSKGLVVEKHIIVRSMCEHHLMPIYGEATVAYVPSKQILGLSKFERIVDFFSSRPQTQERLTEQIRCALAEILSTENVGVIIQSEHACVRHRGIKNPNSLTLTTSLGGKFMHDSMLRQEFYEARKI